METSHPSPQHESPKYSETVDCNFATSGSKLRSVCLLNRRSKACKSDAGVEDNLHIGVPPLNEEEHIDGGSPRSTASQDVGGLSPSSSGNLDDAEEQHPQLHARTRSLVLAQPSFASMKLKKI